jgi:hypothetical protein
MTPWLEQIARALSTARLEAIFVGTGAAAIAGTPTPTIELLVRDTPLHRERVGEVARLLGCTRVPLSHQARTIQLVGGALPIDILFGQLGSETYGAVRARATRVADVLVASSPA